MKSAFILFLAIAMVLTMQGTTLAREEKAVPVEQEIQLLEVAGTLDDVTPKKLQKSDMVRLDYKNFDASTEETIQETLDNGTDILVKGNDLKGIKEKLDLEYNATEDSSENIAAVNISETKQGVHLNVIYYCLYDADGNALPSETEAQVIPELVDYYGLDEETIYNATCESEPAKATAHSGSIQSDSYGYTDTKTIWLWMSDGKNYTAIGGASETLYILKAAKDMPSGVTKDWNVCHFYFFEKNDYKIKDVKSAYRLEENNAKAVIEEVSDMSRKDDRIGLSFSNGNISSSYSFNPNELTIKDYTNDLPYKMHWSTSGNGKTSFKVQPTLLISAGKGTTQTYKAYMYLNHFYVKKGLHSYKISDIGDSNLWITVKPTSRKAATVYAGELM